MTGDGKGDQVDEGPVRDGRFGWHGWLGVGVGLTCAAGAIAIIGGLGWLVSLALPDATPRATPTPTVTTPWSPPTFSIPPNTDPGIVCADGWVSHSVGRGTCSHHGGER